MPGTQKTTKRIKKNVVPRLHEAPLHSRPLLKIAPLRRGGHRVKEPAQIVETARRGTLQNALATWRLILD
jgi:hypothetical protein